MTEEIVSTERKRAKAPKATAKAESTHPMAKHIPDSANAEATIKGLEANGINTAADALNNLRGLEKAFDGDAAQVGAFLKSCNKELSNG